jgi:hypothetical protein
VLSTSGTSRYHVRGESPNVPQGVPSRLPSGVLEIARAGDVIAIGTSRTASSSRSAVTLLSWNGRRRGPRGSWRRPGRSWAASLPVQSAMPPGEPGRHEDMGSEERFVAGPLGSWGCSCWCPSPRPPPDKSDFTRSSPLTGPVRAPR